MLAWGFVGGVMPDILRVVALRFKGAPTYLGSWFFWVSATVLGILGVLACWLVNPAAAVEAFAVGYSAPSILSRLGSEVPDKVRDREDRTARPEVKSLRQWWGSP
jgi:hypothetical protein